MSQDMTITYIDSRNRQLYAAPNAENTGYCIWVENASGHRSLLRGNGVNDRLYETIEQAQNHLNCYASWKRAHEPSRAEWQVIINGKICTIREYNEILSGHALAPTPVPQRQIVSLANIEFRMEQAIRKTQEGMLELGRCLIEAKEGAMVPHGRWEAWVREHAQMSERQAQTLMQLARSVPEGSTMARLSISKMRALLALPESEREQMAERVEAEDMTLSKLQEEVRAAKAKYQAVAQRASVLESNLATANDANSRMRADLAKVQAAADAEEQSYKAQISSLERDLQSARIEALNAPAPTGISPEAQAEIDRLSRELADREEELEIRAGSESRAKQELMHLRAQVAHGTASPDGDTLTHAELGAAVQAFMGRVAVLPHMARYMADCPAETRNAYKMHIDTLIDWCDRALMAINTYSAGEVIVE